MRMPHRWTFLKRFLRPSGIKISGEGDNLAVYGHQFYCHLLQLIECLHRFLLGEILAERPHQRVIFHDQRAVIGVERRQFVDEDTGILVNDKYLERLPKQHTLYESGLVDCAGLLELGEKYGVFRSVEPYDVAVDGRVNLVWPTALIKTLFHFG